MDEKFGEKKIVYERHEKYLPLLSDWTIGPERLSEFI